MLQETNLYPSTEIISASIAHSQAYTQRDVDMLFTTLEVELCWLAKQPEGLPPILRRGDTEDILRNLVDLWWSFHQESWCILHQRNRTLWERDMTLYIDSNHDRSALVRRLHIAQGIMCIDRIQHMRPVADGELIAIKLLTILTDYYCKSLTDG